MRLPIRMKMFALVALVLVLAISAVVWKTSGTFREDKSLFVKEFADRFTGTVARLTVDRVQTLQNNTATFVSNRESLKSVKSQQDVGKILFERFNDAFVVSLVEKRGENWAPVWVERNMQSAAKTWSDGFDNTLVRSLNFDTILTSGLLFTKLAQPSGLPAYGLGFVADLQNESGTGSSKSILVAVVSPVAFEDIIKDFKGDINEVFIVDQKGFVYAHPDAQFMNKNLENYPLVAEIRAQNKEGATGVYTDSDGESIIGSYRKVKGTNLFVVSATPTRAAFQAAEVLIRSVVVFGVGFGLIGIVIAIFVAGRITDPLNRLKAIAAKIGAGDFKIAVDVVSNDEVGELARSIDQMKINLLEREEALEHSKMALIQSEKMSAFGQLSAGIAHEVKNPLAGILGHAQLAKGKTQDPDMKKHIEVIEKETRRTKEIIENLMKFARAEKAELVPTDLFETVSGTVDLVDHQLSLMGVKLIKKLNQVPKVKANSNQLQQVLLNIAMNAGHAMEKSATKELTFILEEVKDLVRIRLQDTGTGMTPEVQKRIFEPFFTTKPAGKGTGLGLSVSMGIVRDHGAKIYVQSEVGKGTTFFIDFPLLGAVANPSATAATASPMAPIASGATSAPTPPPLPKTPLSANGKAEPRVESIVASIPKLENTAVTSATRVLDSPYPSTPAAGKSPLTDKLVAGGTSAGIPSSPFNSKPAFSSKPAEAKPAATAAAKPPPLESPKSEEPKVLGGKAPIPADVELNASAVQVAPAATTSQPEPAKYKLPKIDEPKSEPVAIASAEPPPGPNEKEIGYEQPKTDDDEFKVSIRRPKLKS